MEKEFESAIVERDRRLEEWKKAVDTVAAVFQFQAEAAVDQAEHDFILAAKVCDRTRFEFEGIFENLGMNPALESADGGLGMFPYEVLTGIRDAKFQRFEHWFRQVGVERAKTQGAAV